MRKERRWPPPAKPTLTGHLSVCAGTTGPGSTHLVAGLYEASLDHAPVLALGHAIGAIAQALGPKSTVSRELSSSRPAH